MTIEEEKFSEEMSSQRIDLSGGDAEDGINAGGVENHVAENNNNGDDEEQLKAEEENKAGFADDIPWKTRMWEVFTTFWPLGFVAFGGPQAHIAILRDHLVIQRDWMDEEAFTELFAIGQGLPGPTSTQLVISTALARAGPLGGLLAFFLWNLPGLIVLTVSGVLIANFIDPDDPPFWLVGLPPAAIALVFKAMYGFGSKLDTLGVILALISASVAILISGDEVIKPTSSQYVFPSMLAAGNLIAYIDSKRVKPLGVYAAPSKGWDAKSDLTMRRIGIPLWVGFCIFLVYIFVLVLTILLVDVFNVNNEYLKIFEVMFRIGSIIFGGGQVVLPMLQNEVVPFWMTKDNFFQGLGIAQSMPGPLFNFSAYLGAVYKGVGGALVAYVGLFGPGVILIFAVVPFWARLRHVNWFKVMLNGVNSTAIGLVGAACVILWEAAIGNAADAIVFCFSGVLAVVFDVAAPICVIAGGVLGAILSNDVANLGQVPY